MVSWLTVSLTEIDTEIDTEVGTGTTLELTHTAAVDPGMWKQFGPGAVGLGWDLTLVGIGMHLESGRPVPAEVKVTEGLFTFVALDASYRPRAVDQDGSETIA